MLTFEQEYPLFTKEGDNHYTAGEFELRKLNTGNWVFRHDRKDNCYIDLGSTLSTAKMAICLLIITDLNF